MSNAYQNAPLPPIVRSNYVQLGIIDVNQGSQINLQAKNNWGRHLRRALFSAGLIFVASGCYGAVEVEPRHARNYEGVHEERHEERREERREEPREEHGDNDHHKEHHDDDRHD